jgi:hypothetical protein
VGTFRRISVSELVAVDLPHFHKGTRQYKKRKQSILHCIAYLLCPFLSAFKSGPSTSTRQMSTAPFVAHFPCPVLSLPLYTTTVLSRVKEPSIRGGGGVWFLLQYVFYCTNTVHKWDTEEKGSETANDDICLCSQESFLYTRPTWTIPNFRLRCSQHCEKISTDVVQMIINTVWRGLFSVFPVRILQPLTWSGSWAEKHQIWRSYSGSCQRMTGLGRSWWKMHACFLYPPPPTRA